MEVEKLANPVVIVQLAVVSLLPLNSEPLRELIFAYARKQQTYKKLLIHPPSRLEGRGFPVPLCVPLGAGLSDSEVRW